MAESQNEFDYTDLPEGEWQRVFTVAHDRAARQHFTDDDGNDIGVMPGGHAAAGIHHALTAALQAGWRPRMPESETEIAQPVRMRQDEDKFDATRSRIAAYFTGPGPVNEVAVTLMAAWEVGEGKPVTPSYVATFADMAAAVLAVHPNIVSASTESEVRNA